MRGGTNESKEKSAKMLNPKKILSPPHLSLSRGKGAKTKQTKEIIKAQRDNKGNLHGSFYVRQKYLEFFPNLVLRRPVMKKNICNAPRP